MKPRHFYALLAIVFIVLSATNLNAQCCRPPQTLTVKSVTDSSFCVKWIVNDSLGCDSAKAFQINYRPMTATVWTSVIQFYHHDTVYVFCDTGTACVKYQWKVRNACLHNGDTIVSDWVTGPKFTLACDSGKPRMTPKINAQKGHDLSATPNPTKNNLVLSGYFNGTLTITITNLNGKKMFDKSVATQNGKLSLPIDVTHFEKGLYFINIVDGSAVFKTTFIKE